MFRGEFVGLNGGADFYAKDINGLKKRLQYRLKLFLICVMKRVLNSRKIVPENLMFVFPPNFTLIFQVPQPQKARF